MKQKNFLRLLAAGMVVVGAAALAFSVAIPAWAGGWATITLDEWPQGVKAGQTITVGFTVRQHGRDDARMGYLDASVTIRNQASNERQVVPAEYSGADGYYAAEVTFPSAGTWQWSVQAYSIDQPMPPLEVAEAEGAPVAAGKQPAAGLQMAAYPLAAGGLGLALLAGIAVLMGGRRARWALAGVVIGLAAGGFGLVSAAAQPERGAPPTSNSTLAPAELGERLFVAKGCVQCHLNGRVPNNLVVFSTEVGPNLTHYTASPEYLEVWLKDPESAKPQTQMPNLELKKTEIDALIAFLTADLAGKP